MGSSWLDLQDRHCWAGLARRSLLRRYPWGYNPPPPLKIEAEFQFSKATSSLWGAEFWFANGSGNLWGAGKASSCTNPLKLFDGLPVHTFSDSKSLKVCDSLSVNSSSDAMPRSLRLKDTKESSTLIHPKIPGYLQLTSIFDAQVSLTLKSVSHTTLFHTQISSTHNVEELQKLSSTHNAQKLQ